jgi:hypothetical protein
MSTTESDPEDAITKEEIAGVAPTPESTSAGVSQGKRSACKQPLMLMITMNLKTREIVPFLFTHALTYRCRYTRP